MHDVYAFGVIAPSTLIELADDLPAPGGYAEIASVQVSIGGEAAGSAYVLARLGVATKLAGNRLGTDVFSIRTIELLSDAGVDCSAIARTGGVDSVKEVVLSHGDARTVLGTYRRLDADRAWEAPCRDDVASSRIVCLDPFFGEESAAVARWCQELGIPYVTVDTPPDAEITRFAEVVIVSEEYASQAIGTVAWRELLATYTQRCQGLVILTRGGDSAWYGRGSEPPSEHLPFPVEVRDTTGAGDSFRAGIIYGILKGLSVQSLIRVASAVAALVCQRAPGVLNSPSADEVSAFLASHP
jgi:sugar/nucleoside kinase (ribokinase family)